MSMPKGEEKLKQSRCENLNKMENIKEKLAKNPIEILRKKITPLYKDPYKFQLEYKYRYVRSNLCKLTKSVYHHAVNRGLEPPTWCVNQNISSEIEKKKDAIQDCNGFSEISLKPILSTIGYNQSHTKVKSDNNSYNPCINGSDDQDFKYKNPYSYRNKCEFTIGFTTGELVDIDSEISVGFVSHIDRFEPIVVGIIDQGCDNSEKIDLKLGDQEKVCNNIICENDKDNSSINYTSKEIEIIHPCVFDIVKITEEMVKISSTENNYKVYSRRNRKGIWRLLLVRISETHKEIMVTLQTTRLKDLKDKNNIVNLMINYLSEEGCSKKNNISLMNYRVSSLYLHQSDSIVDTFDSGELELVWGKSEITLNICNTDLSVGPLSFFQTNTKGCEVLYGVIKEIVLDNYLKYVNENNDGNKSIDLLVLDICCGTGAIGITILNAFRKLINENSFNVKNIDLYGVDCCEEAIESAKKNAINNGIMNAKYICGAAENVLPGLLSELSLKESYIVAIVDPPRSGLHTSVVKSFRDLNEVENLIYVSCNVESLIKNCLELCSAYDPVKDKKSNCLNVFEPEYAIPIDMFPHTKHVETVLYLSRNSNKVKDCSLNSEQVKKRRIMKNPLLS
ncbi:RNA methylase [Cryptosporidium xiaoi]|uniref:RNA methylase n=1 Tax=Cryptosporidium xiaoi TaxID=659607 RepID=A0AAV9Y2Z2_9CRYT